MAGIKIINVLKDDSLADILEVFRQAPAGEVIFVLPKNGKIFRSDDHFAVFAGEASSSGKTISILTTNSEIAARARTHGFNVMVSSTTKRVRKPKAGASPETAVVPTIIAASSPPPADDDVQDTSEDAFQDDVVVPTDETMGPHEPAEPQLEPEPEAELLKPDEDLDYIDKVWRDRAAQQSGAVVAVSQPATIHRFRIPTIRVVPLTRRTVIALVVIAVIIFGAAVYLTAGSAIIAVSPATQPVDEHINVTVSDGIASVDAAFGKLPGQLLDFSKSSTHTQTATGSRDVASKAKGTITVYNEYSSAPQTLVATTRFTAPNGLVFRTLSTVNVPGSTVSKGAAVPGSITVNVIADKPGTEYDIAAGSFIIAAFKEKGDTDRAAKIYGKSTAPMTGGANGPSTVITQSDYDSAKSAAAADAQALIAEALKSQTGGMRVAQDTPTSALSYTSNAQPDDAAASVSVTATDSLKTVAFRQEDLDKLVADTILRKDRLNVNADQLNVKLTSVVFDESLGSLTFTAEVTGTGYAPIDTTALATAVKGLDMTAFKQYVESREDIKQASLNLQPFWVHHLPTDDSRIRVNFLEH